MARCWSVPVCNRWGHPGAKKLTLVMLEEDLEALRARERQKHSLH